MLKHQNALVQFEHVSKREKNNSYINNVVRQAVNDFNNNLADECVIKLDGNKITQKVYTGTICYLYNRDGSLVSIVDKENLIHVVSNSSPIHGDKFNKYEGRKFALINALSKLKLTRNHAQFDELLRVKLFLKRFELNDNVDCLSWEFMDLWLALLKYHESLNNDTDTSLAADLVTIEAKKFAGSSYEKFEPYLTEFVNTWRDYINEDLSTAYKVFKVIVRQQY